MSELANKERTAIKILRMYRGDDPIEVSYSGGKDSDDGAINQVVATELIDALYDMVVKLKEGE